MPSKKVLKDEAVSGRHDDVPDIAACFLIRFDQRIGYTIAWQRTIPGLELDGVEYKSLPSGLHNIERDLIYFDHDQYIGVTSFIKSLSSEAERNASFIAVGVLVVKDHEHVGQAWRHSAGLKKLSKELLPSRDDTQSLETYWAAHRVGHERSQGKGARSKSKDRAGESWSDFDPKLSLSQTLEEIGPLIFPLHRAALLRRRLLFIKHPPLRPTCELVHNLSTLAAISSSHAADLRNKALAKIKPFFTIGIQDIPMLEQHAARASDNEAVIHTSDSQQSSAAGWIACSSDELLATKTALSDLRIIFPKINSAQGGRRWPDAFHSDDTKLQATQRDLRRYVALRQCILSTEANDTAGNDEANDDTNNDHATLLRSREIQSYEVQIPEEGSVVEPQSWALIAYDSYMWWASAGERASTLQEEYDQDLDLFFTPADFSNDEDGYAKKTDLPRMRDDNHVDVAPSHAIFAYFRGLTQQTMMTLKHIVDAADPESPDDRVFVSKEDLSAMGLDPWSHSDRIWVTKMIKLHFGHETIVQGASVECCGVKLY